jgi:hypothetical protein
MQTLQDTKTSDKELLELAAKAAGLKDMKWTGISLVKKYDPSKPDHETGCVGNDWNPLTDDGDALRLAVKLGISLLPYPVYKENNRHSVIAKQRRMSDLLREQNPTEIQELNGNDPYAATRRAIVKAAAEIGKDMK